MKLYHKDVFFKPHFHTFAMKGVSLKFSAHLVERLIERGIDTKKIPVIINNVANVKVIEVETEDDGMTVHKQLVRYPYDSSNDLVMAIVRNGLVKTAWVNSKTDNHRTLDKSKYERR